MKPWDGSGFGLGLVLVSVSVYFVFHEDSLGESPSVIFLGKLFILDLRHLAVLRLLGVCRGAKSGHNRSIYRRC
jgi:hypothetical protein